MSFTPNLSEARMSQSVDAFVALHEFPTGGVWLVKEHGDHWCTVRRATDADWDTFETSGLLTRKGLALLTERKCTGLVTQFKDDNSGIREVFIDGARTSGKTYSNDDEIHAQTSNVLAYAVMQFKDDNWRDNWEHTHYLPPLGPALTLDYRAIHQRNTPIERTIERTDTSSPIKQTTEMWISAFFMWIAAFFTHKDRIEIDRLTVDGAEYA